MYTEFQKNRFFTKIIIMPSGCHNWTGAKKPTGYGNIRINSKYKLSHRVAWEIENGEIPQGLIVMHICDNPCCCNPMHLVLGTSKQNTADMIKKGRSGMKKNKACGERNGNSKMKIDDVVNVSTLYKTGISQANIAKIYGVSQTNIGNIINKKTWRENVGK